MMKNEASSLLSGRNCRRNLKGISYVIRSLFYLVDVEWRFDVNFIVITFFHEKKSSFFMILTFLFVLLLVM